MWTEAYRGYWIATTYDAIRSALLDPENFSTRISADRSEVVPSEVDGAEHDDARLPFNKHFSISNGSPTCNRSSSGCSPDSYRGTRGDHE